VHVPAELPLIEIGDSDELLVGELVVAIGSPFGLQQSVTAGVVSAIGRSLIEPTGRAGVYPLVDVIQTDAAINPGNSGGALVDRQGNLIGINTAIFSGSGTNGGIGFAVPVNTAIRVADEIIATGSAEAPFIGISGQTVSEQLAEAEGLATDEGALVVELIEGTKAQESELQPGDVIVSYEGDPIRSMDDLILAVRQSVVGDEAVLEAYRGEDLMEITIVVGPKPEAL
jgi:putative serine protease PepD